MRKAEGMTPDLDLAYAVAQSQNAKDLSAAAERFSARHGFRYWAYALAGPEKALTNYPAPIVSTYIENRWHRGCDPVVEAIHRQHRALSWHLDELVGDRPLDERQHHLIECRRELGAWAGVSAPAYGRRDDTFEFAIVSFSRDRPLSDAAQRHYEPRVQLFAAYFVSVAEDIFGCPCPHPDTEPPALTQRERDCLSWAAVGKSSWEIGKLLNITAATVNFHLGNAAAKLGVHGRVCAVTQAIRLGLISPA
jgi:DNA-binding CsgD family transcriptional regulator